jgi:hypothetical protein
MPTTDTPLPTSLVVLLALVLANGLTFILTPLLLILRTSHIQSAAAAILNCILTPDPLAIMSIMALISLLLTILLATATKAPVPPDPLDAALGS